MAITGTSDQFWPGTDRKPAAEDFPAEDGLALVRLPWPSAVRLIGLISLALWGIIAALVMLVMA